MKKNLPLAITFLFFVSSLFAEKEIRLPEITTYISTPVAEQKTVLTEEDIENKHTADLPSLLQSVGIQLLSYGAYGLESKPSLRGFTDETVRVVIDGVCVNNAQYGTFDFTTLNLDNIEKIEIVKGGFTEGVNDEDAVGGVIYITTKKQNLGNSFSSNTSLGTFLNKEKPVDSISQSLNGNLLLSENTFANFSTKGTFACNEYLFYRKQEPHFSFYKIPSAELAQIQKNARVYDGNLNANITHYFGNGNYFTAGNIFYAGNKNCPGPVDSTNQGVQKDFNNNLTVTVFTPAIAGCMNIKNTAAYLYSKRFYDDNNGHSIHDINNFKYTGSIDYYKFDFLEQSASISFDYTHLDSTDDGLHDQYSVAVKEVSKIFLGECFSLSIPLAIKTCNNNFAFVPKAGLRLRTKYADFLLDAYRMVQFPNMDDLYWNGGGWVGNPDLQPEKGFGGELSFNVHEFFIPFTLSIFTNYYTDKIQWHGNTVDNVSNAFYAGFDLTAEKSFLKEKLIFKLNAEYLYTKLLDKSNRLTYGKKIMWTPDVVASLITRYNFTNGSCELETIYTGKRYVSNVNASYLCPYMLINFCIDYSFVTKHKNKINPYMRINNLLNANYESVENYSMPGLSITCGVKISR